MSRLREPSKEQLAQFVEMLMDPANSKQAIARHFGKHLVTIYRWEQKLPADLRRKINERRKQSAINPQNARLPINKQWVKDWATVKQSTVPLILSEDESGKPIVREAPSGAIRGDGQLNIVRQLMEINQKTWNMLEILHGQVTEDFALEIQRIGDLLQKVEASGSTTLPPEIIELIKKKIDALGVPDVSDYIKVIREIREQIKLQVDITTQLCNLQAQYEFVNDMVYIIDEVVGSADPNLKHRILSELEKRRAVRQTIGGFASIAKSARG